MNRVSVDVEALEKFVDGVFACANSLNNFVVEDRCIEDWDVAELLKSLESSKIDFEDRTRVLEELNLKVQAAFWKAEHPSLIECIPLYNKYRGTSAGEVVGRKICFFLCEEVKGLKNLEEARAFLKRVAQIGMELQDNRAWDELINFSARLVGERFFPG